MLLLPSVAIASYAPLTYRYQHHLFTVDPDKYPEWHSTEEVWTYNGREIRVPADLRVDGDDPLEFPQGMAMHVRPKWDYAAISRTLQSRIADKLNRERGAVAIRQTETGTVVFEGLGMLGREVDLYASAILTVDALKQEVTDIILPVRELQPEITVLSPGLLDRGIREVLSVGESDFSGSPWARRHNINVGLNRFNGHLIPQGEVFSFNDVLGYVGPSTGYWQELVIKGDKTLPDYGGGLCQVSTTAYRGVWEYGFPIEQRRNHSFAVSYYSPQGTDATIYPPATDIKFLNDGPSDVLIQTHVNTGSSLAYFIYYGTRDSRKTDLIGPYTWGHAAPPPDRTEYTDEIPPGTTRKVGSRVPGLRAAWFRIVHPASGTGEIIEPVYSAYEARPLYHQIGISAKTEPEEPGWIGNITTAPPSPPPKPVRRHTQRRPRSPRRGIW